MTETRSRTWIKALGWQLLGLLTMATVGYLTTGSWQDGGKMALASAVVSLTIYVVYERLWDRVNWGRLNNRA